MLRTVHKAIRATSAGGKDSTFKTAKPTFQSISSPPKSSALGSISLVSSKADEFDWESVDDFDNHFEREHGFLDYSVPSSDEVHHALSSLHQVLGSSSFYIKDRHYEYLDSDVTDEIDSPTGRVNSPVSELDWIEPPLYLCNSRAVESYRSDEVYDAFHLLQNDPSVQRMVISLSSDKAVWDAVMNNDVVREIRASLSEEARMNITASPDEGSDRTYTARAVLNWILEDTKSRFVELIEKFKSLVSYLFQCEVNENSEETRIVHFDKRVRSSFMISVVILLIVVLNRASRS
jgi:hypothetical protein